MSCKSPNTQYKFRFDNANITTQIAVTGEDCPAPDSNLEAETYYEAKRRFQAYLDSHNTSACDTGCRLHTATEWQPVPGLGQQVKLKRIFFSVSCTDAAGETHTCLYSFEVVFFYTMLQRTVTCIPDLSGPNDFFMAPVSFEKECERA